MPNAKSETTEDSRLILALSLIVRLHNEGVLSEGQCSRALNMDRLDWREIRDELTEAAADE